MHHCNCLKNNQHDVTCGLSFIFVRSRHSLSTCFELSGSSSSGDHFSLQSASGIVCNLCCSPPVLLRVLLPISRLRPVVLNFGKDFEVSSKIIKGSFSENGLFLLVEAISSLLAEGI